jgi:uncharacterized damage-inducible protein DinB
MPMNAPLISNEREGLLGFLDHQRQALRYAVYGLPEDQARRRPTASELSLGGLVKHLLYGERTWTDRIEGRPVDEDAAFAEYMASFVLTDEETLAGLVQQYEDAGARTDAVVARIDDLGQSVPLPVAPWYPDPEGCTVRWVLLHLIEETARHAGHADILREALDGAQGGPLMAAAEGWPADGWVKPWQPA